MALATGVRPPSEIWSGREWGIFDTMGETKAKGNSMTAIEFIVRRMFLLAVCGACLSGGMLSAETCREFRYSSNGVACRLTWTGPETWQRSSGMVSV